MNIEFIDGLIIPIITACALCIGFVMKRWLPTDDKWIPTVLLVLGAISGAVVFGFSYEGIVKGMVSGLAAVGLHQAFKQHLKIDVDPDELYTRGPGFDDYDEEEFEPDPDAFDDEWFDEDEDEIVIND